MVTIHIPKSLFTVLIYTLSTVYIEVLSWMSMLLGGVSSLQTAPQMSLARSKISSAMIHTKKEMLYIVKTQEVQAQK